MALHRRRAIVLLGATLFVGGCVAIYWRAVHRDEERVAQLVRNCGGRVQVLTIHRDVAFGYTRRATSVRAIDISDTDCAKRVLPELKYLDAIENFRAVNAGVDDAMCGYVREAESITVLHLSGNVISDQGVVEIAHLPRLESLTLSGTRVTDESGSAIESFRSLRFLAVDDCSIGDEFVLKIGNCRQLETVSMRDSNVTGRTLNAFITTSGVRSVDVSECAINWADMVVETKGSMLEGFDADFTEGDAKALQWAASHQRLRRLSMAGMTLRSEAGLSVLGRLSGLLSLALRESNLEGCNLGSAAECQSLISVDVSGSRLDDGFCEGVSRLRALEYIYLDDTNADDKMLMPLLECESLKYVSIRGTTVTRAFLENLQRRFPDCSIVH